MSSVKNGYIRTEADELQYNLHIMLRYDLERALIAGDLMVNDLEAAWNDRFLADFGYAVPKASLGMLQDIHWSEWLPTPLPLAQAMLRDAPNAIDELAEGYRYSTHLVARQRSAHGRRYKAQEVIEKATGQAASSEPFVRYIREKFAEL